MFYRVREPYEEGKAKNISKRFCCKNVGIIFTRVSVFQVTAVELKT